MKSGSQIALLVLSIIEIIVCIGIFSLVASSGGGYEAAIILVVAAIIGALGIWAAFDATKIMPIWVIALIQLVSGAALFIVSAVAIGFTYALANCGSPIVSAAVIFWLANNIKKQARELRPRDE